MAGEPVLVRILSAGARIFLQGQEVTQLLFFQAFVPSVDERLQMIKVQYQKDLWLPLSLCGLDAVSSMVPVCRYSSTDSLSPCRPISPRAGESVPHACSGRGRGRTKAAFITKGPSSNPEPSIKPRCVAFEGRRISPERCQMQCIMMMILSLGLHLGQVRTMHMGLWPSSIIALATTANLAPSMRFVRASP